MKKFLSVCMVMVLLLAACGGSEKTTMTGELKFSWWGGDERNEATLKVIELYESKNPDVKITPEFYSYDDYKQKMTVLIPSGKAPDLLQLDNGWVELYGIDQFVDLSTMSTLDLNNWDADTLDLTTTDSKVMGVPTSVNSIGFAFIDTFWNAAGMETPTSIEGMMEAAPALKAKLGDDYYPLSNNLWLLLEYIIIQETGKQSTDDTCNVLTSESDLVKAYTLMKKLDETGTIPPLNFGMETPQPTPLIPNGKIGAVYDWNSSLANITGDLPAGGSFSELKPFLEKEDRKATGVLSKAAMSFSISSASSKQELAADFLNFMNTDEEAVLLLGTLRGTPANNVAFDILEKNSKLSGTPYKGTLAAREVDKQPLTKCGLDMIIRDDLRDNIAEMRSGKTTAAEAAKKHLAIIEKGKEELKTLGMI